MLITLLAVNRCDRQIKGIAVVHRGFVTFFAFGSRRSAPPATKRAHRRQPAAQVLKWPRA